MIVTGDASGIGREVARRFGDADATVLVADLQEEPNVGDVPTHELIREAGGEAAFVETDVSVREDIETLVEAPGNTAAST